MAISSSQPEASYVAELIRKDLKAKAEVILQDVIEEATKELTQALVHLADTVALNVLTYYDVRQQGDNVVITVKKKIDGDE